MEALQSARAVRQSEDGTEARYSLHDCKGCIFWPGNGKVLLAPQRSDV